jgi:ABC-type transport system substrate-binding protein
LPPRFGMTSERLPHNPGLALELLSEAGMPAEPLRLLQVWAPRPYLPHPGPVAKTLRRQLEAVGLRVQIDVPRGAEEFFGRQKAGDYDLLLGGWIADLADPAEFLTAVLHSSRIPRPSVRGAAQGNLSRIADPELDTAIEAYQVEDSDAARTRVLDRAAALAPLVPIMYGATALVHSWHLRSLEISPYGVPNFGGVRIA